MRATEAGQEAEDIGPAVASAPSAFEERPPWRRRAWALVRVPVTLYAKVYALLFVVSWLSIELLERHPSYTKPPASFRGTNFLEGWVRWDGNWYQLIVTEGYFFTPGKQSSVAFFPSYPLIMKVVNVALRDVFFTAVVVSLICGLGAVVLFYRWCSARTSPAVARLAVLTFILYPYAWYLFGATYADATFLVATLGAFVLLEHDRPVLAGLAGIVATAARPVGLGVIVGLIAVTLERNQILVIGERFKLQFDRHRFRARQLGVLLAPLGLAGWCFYLWRNWGNPLLFAETEGAAGWDQAAGPRTWFKVELFEHLGSLPKWVHDTIWPLDVRGYDPWTNTVYTIGITFQALIVLGVLVLVPRVFRRVGWGYALYVLCVAGIPLLGSKDFQGAGRYMLAAFPCFFLVAEWLHGKERLQRAWLPISGTLLVVFTSLFARGYYLA